jgi:hypothetical protein
VYHGPGKPAWETKPRPEIRDADTFGNAAKERALKVILQRVS